MSQLRLPRKSFAAYSPVRSIAAALALTIAAIVACATGDETVTPQPSQAGVHATEAPASPAPGRS